jgi:DNA primase
MTNGPITFTESEIATYFRYRVPKLKPPRGAESRCACLIHGGTNDNFAVNMQSGFSYCHSKCGTGWDIPAFEQALTGVDFKSAKAEIFRIIGRSDEPRELSFGERFVTAYNYDDEGGRLLYQIVRLHSPKDFLQRRPNGKGGWIWKKSPRQVLYRLPEVAKARVVFVTEGEKDADTLRGYGFVATTNAGGAKAPWLPEYTASLAHCDEVILATDNDAAGRERVTQIAKALVGKVPRLVVFEPDGAKDITDWFAQGHSELELIEQVERGGT